MTWADGTEVLFRVKGEVVGGFVKIGCKHFAQDQIAEVATDLVAKAPKPKWAVGDRVVYTGTILKDYTGKHGVVTGTVGQDAMITLDDGEKLTVYAISLAKSNHPKFQAGDVYLSSGGEPRVRDEGGDWRDPTGAVQQYGDHNAVAYVAYGTSSAFPNDQRRWIVVGGKPVAWA